MRKAEIGARLGTLAFILVTTGCSAFPNASRIPVHLESWQNPGQTESNNSVLNAARKIVEEIKSFDYPFYSKHLAQLKSEAEILRSGIQKDALDKSVDILFQDRITRFQNDEDKKRIQSIKQNAMMILTATQFTKADINSLSSDQREFLIFQLVIQGNNILVEENKIEPDADLIIQH